jgi:ATP-binding cassette subfamily B protein
MSLGRFVLDVARRYPGLLAANVAMLFCFVIVDAFSVVTLAPIVDFLTQESGRGGGEITRRAVLALEWLGVVPGLESFLVVFLALLVFKAITSTLLFHLILRAKYAFLRDLMVGLFADFFAARWLFFARSRTGTLLNTFLREVALVGDGFGALASLLAAFAHLLLYLTVPLYLSWQVTLASLGAGLLVALPFLAFGRLSYRLGRANTETANAMGEALQESLGAAKLILGLALEERVVRRYAAAFEAHREVTLRSQTLGAAIPNLYLPVGFGVIALALVLGRRFGIPTSELAVLVFSLSRMVPVMAQITGFKSSGTGRASSASGPGSSPSRASGRRSRWRVSRTPTPPGRTASTSWSSGSREGG